MYYKISVLYKVILVFFCNINQFRLRTNSPCDYFEETWQLSANRLVIWKNSKNWAMRLK